MASTNVPQVAWAATGFQAPAELDILTGVQADQNAAFNGVLNLALTEPQGQLASSLTAIVGNVNDTFLYMASQFDPAYAEGRNQDALARIYFIERNPAQSTVLQISCMGLAGVTIPANQLIQDSSGNNYACTGAGTIPSGGSVTLSFACTVTGAIPIPSSTSVSIYQSIPGWDSVTCEGGTIGNAVETTSAFEARRAASVAQNSNGSIPSVLGAVLSVSGVLDAFVTENTMATAQTIGGVSLNPNSLYVAAVGGTAAAVAQAIWTKKAPGCAYNGNTTVTVYDTSAVYSPPYPSYSVSFEIPNDLQIFFAVAIATSAAVPSNATALIQAAIISAFAGGDGGSRARIGSEVLASRYYAPIAALGSWAQIVSIQIGSINTPSATFAGTISGVTLNVSSVASGTIAVGQLITDAGGLIASGTTVIAFGSGTGGTGTYTVSASQTVALETIYAVSPTLFKIQSNINQVPSITSANIAVSLA